MTQNWDDAYEEARGDMGFWEGLMASPAWQALVRAARGRSTDLRRNRGLLMTEAEVARHNFEMGIIAGIEWVSALPEAYSVEAKERADHALAAREQEIEHVEPE